LEPPSIAGVEYWLPDWRLKLRPADNLERCVAWRDNQYTEMSFGIFGPDIYFGLASLGDGDGGAKPIKNVSVK